VVAQDKSEALFMLVRSSASPQSETAPVRLDGLDAGARYLLKRLLLPGEPASVPGDRRGRDSVDEATLPGSLLMKVGTRAPFLRPEGAALFHLSKQPS
jgi:hypothetical protein